MDGLDVKILFKILKVNFHSYTDIHRNGESVFKSENQIDIFKYIW